MLHVTHLLIVYFYSIQFSQEVEEKAPLLKQQRQDYDHALRTIEKMSKNLDLAITENHQMKNVRNISSESVQTSFVLRRMLQEN